MVGKRSEPPFPDFDGGLLAAFTMLLDAEERAKRGGHSLLTEEGACYVRQLLSSLQSGGSAPNAIALPYWDNEQLQLWFGGRVLATLRHRGSYMSEILDAFQRVGWTSRRIANPLSRVSDESNGEAQLRLNNTLKNLNRELLAGTIRFCAEDHGARVRWDYCTTKCAAKRGFTTRFITNRNR